MFGRASVCECVCYGGKRAVVSQDVRTHTITNSTRSYVFAHFGYQRLALRLDTLLAATEETLLERGVALLHRRTPLGVVDQ